MTGTPRAPSTFPPTSSRPSSARYTDRGYRLALVAGHDDDDTIRIVYLLTQPGTDARVELVTRVDHTTPRIPSLSAVSFPAGRFERELADHFGVVPTGHTQLRRLVHHQHWPDDWHPLRHDAGRNPRDRRNPRTVPVRHRRRPRRLRNPRRSRPRRTHRTRTLPVLGHRRNHHHDEGPPLVRTQRNRETLSRAPLQHRERARGTHQRATPPSATTSPTASPSKTHSTSGPARRAIPPSPAPRTRTPLQPRRRHRRARERRRLRHPELARPAHPRTAPPTQPPRHRPPPPTRRDRRRRRARPGTSRQGRTRGHRRKTSPRSRTSRSRTQPSSTASPAPPPSTPKPQQNWASSVPSHALPASTSTPAATTPSSTSPTRSRSSSIDAGDVRARFCLRRDEFAASINLIGWLLDQLATATTNPPSHRSPHDKPAVSGVGLVEAWRGTIAHRVEIAPDGKLTRLKIVDPSFFNWPALPARTRRHHRPRLPPHQQELQPLLRRQRPLTFGLTYQCSADHRNEAPRPRPMPPARRPRSAARRFASRLLT